MKTDKVVKKLGVGAKNNTNCRSFSYGIRSFPTVIPSHGINPTEFFCIVCCIPPRPNYKKKKPLVHWCTLKTLIVFYHILVFGTLSDLPEKEKWLFLLYCVFVYELYYFLFTSFIKNPTRRVKAKIIFSWIISVFIWLIFWKHCILKLSDWNNKKQTTTIFLRICSSICSIICLFNIC